MIESRDGWLRYFEGVHRRTLRDVTALPPEAAAWRPPPDAGEPAWDIGELVAHVARSRGFFAGVYRGEGWIMPPAPDTAAPDRWGPALEASAAGLRERLRETPDEWLRRRVPLIDGDGEVAGWRVLMMLIEHEVHHRAQIDACAGLSGWRPPDLFGMSAEAIAGREAAQRAARRDG